MLFRLYIEPIFISSWKQQILILFPFHAEKFVFLSLTSVSRNIGITFFLSRFKMFGACNCHFRFFFRVDVQQLELLSKMFNNWLTDPLNSTITNEHKFLCDYLMLMHASIRKPWKTYLECQEALRQILTLRANHYVYYSDLIL